MYLNGASGHAKVIIGILEKNGVKIHGSFDDNFGVKSLLDYPVLGSPNTNKTVKEEVIVSIDINTILR